MKKQQLIQATEGHGSSRMFKLVQANGILINGDKAQLQKI